MFALMQQLRQHKEVESCYPFGQHHHVVFKNPAIDEREIRQLVSSIDSRETTVERIAPTIEDSFMKLMRQ